MERHKAWLTEPSTLYAEISFPFIPTAPKLTIESNCSLLKRSVLIPLKSLGSGLALKDSNNLTRQLPRRRLEETISRDGSRGLGVGRPTPPSPKPFGLKAGVFPRLPCIGPRCSWEMCLISGSPTSGCSPTAWRSSECLRHVGRGPRAVGSKEGLGWAGEALLRWKEARRAHLPDVIPADGLDEVLDTWLREMLVVISDQFAVNGWHCHEDVDPRSLETQEGFPDLEERASGSEEIPLAIWPQRDGSELVALAQAGPGGGRRRIKPLGSQTTSRANGHSPRPRDRHRQRPTSTSSQSPGVSP